MTPLRVGVVGYGQRGVLASCINQCETRAAVVAVCDPDPEAGQRARHAFGGGVAVRTHHESLLDLDLDGVMLLSPDHQHHDQALTFLRAGIPVYCEKPLAISVADCDRLLDAAEESQTGLFVGHNMRFMPVVTTMKDAIERGLIGEVKTIWVRHFVGHGGDYYFKDWHAQRRHTNGLLLQKGAHDIDVIHWLASGFTRRVTGMGALAVYGDVESGGLEEAVPGLAWPPSAQRDLAPDIDVEDLSMMLMQLDNGVLASYQQCHFTPDYWRSYTVIGSHGKLENRGDESGAEVHVWNNRSAGYRSAGDVVLTVPEAEGGHGGADPAIIAEWLRTIRGEPPLFDTALAAREAVATASAATASLRSRSDARDVQTRNQERVTG